MLPIPDPSGYAGAFARVGGRALLMTGGSNFPRDRGPWDGDVKRWSDQMWALEEPGGEWRRAGRLPRPIGYGVALTLADGLLCVGGADAERHHDDVFLLAY